MSSPERPSPPVRSTNASPVPTTAPPANNSALLWPGYYPAPLPYEQISLPPAATDDVDDNDDVNETSIITALSQPPMPALTASTSPSEARALLIQEFTRWLTALPATMIGIAGGSSGSEFMLPLRSDDYRIPTWDKVCSDVCVALEYRHYPPFQTAIYLSTYATLISPRISMATADSTETSPSTKSWPAALRFCRPPPAVVGLFGGTLIEPLATPKRKSALGASKRSGIFTACFFSLLTPASSPHPKGSK